MDYITELMDNGYEELEYSSPDDYFEEMCADKLDLPTWNDELQHHASGCYSATSLTISNSITSISGNAFQGCYSLISIELPNSVTRIGIGAFSYCRCMKSISIPNSVTTIEKECFLWCEGLTKIIYKGTVKQWENVALVDGWRNWSGLKSIVCADGVV